MIDPWYLDNLACPIDRGALTAANDALWCADGHRYSVVDGIPIMLRTDVPQTISLATASLRRATGEEVDSRAPALHLESLGISDDEKRGVVALAATPGGVDPVVTYLVAATNGLMYKHLIGGLLSYPIPAITLGPGRGRRLVDVGCSWGRWTIAADRAGYDAVGIDPSLGAIMAARRVAQQLGVPNHYVCADARYLPFADRTVDATYSYSVLQHLSHADATEAVGEMGRVLKPGGVARVQMPTRFGVRCLYHQARRGFRPASGFEVRYWSLGALSRLFRGHVGPSHFDVDGYFGIGLQASDEALMTPRLRRVLHASERLKAWSRRWRPLIVVADSVFAHAVKNRPLRTEDQ